MDKHLESLSKQDIYRQGVFAGQMQIMDEIMSQMPPQTYAESRVGLASGPSQFARILTDYIRILREGTKDA